MTKLSYTDSEGNEFNIVREPNAGGWLQGHVYVNYSELVSAFGNPCYLGSGDGKVQAEWTLKINGEMVTIYDYKEYGKPVQHIREWHIGGTSKDAVEMVEGALAAYRQGL
ncbi:MAG: hypothetical protein EBT77_06820 [Verrucomicrobia bacterium]|nr:hypothetical protein [Verrucomicrobiota bacterium]